MHPTRDYISLIINHKPHVIKNSQAFIMLADYLRSVVYLTGTKIVCAEGDCGACTVLCYCPELGEDSGFMPINACIVLVAQLDNAQILTVESLKRDGALSLVQRLMVNNHASQCGYCTPGFAMILTALAQKNSGKFNDQEIKNNLTGNLCRCTGYQSIIDAAKNINNNHEKLIKINNIKHKPENIHISSNNQEFFAPLSLNQASSWLTQNLDAKILGNGTDLGVMINKNKTTIHKILSLNKISELYKISREENILKVGARVSLSTLRTYCKSVIPELARFINIFASPQIKNMATLIGNVANASPIADLPPFLLVMDAQVKILSSQNSRLINLRELFISYKRLSLSPGEFISHISFTIPKASEYLRLYKLSQRRDLDISTLNGALCCELDHKDNNIFIKDARIALGGVAEITKRLTQTENLLKNQKLSVQLVERALVSIQQEINPLDDLRGSASFRRVLIDGMVRRYFEEIMGNNYAPA